MKKYNMNRNTLVFAAIAAAAVIGTGSTMAYFTETASQVNSFTTGNLELGLHELEWNPGDGDGQNMYPGYTVYKNPTVKNITTDKNGEEPCYVRINLSILDKDNREVTDRDALSLIYKTIYYDSSFTGTYDKMDGQAYGLIEGRVPGYNLSELAQFPMVNPQWVKDTGRSTPANLVFNYIGRDGKGILNIGEESSLFTAVVIPTDWNQKHIDSIGDYQLKITAQAIQSKGFVSQSEAFHMLDEEMAGGQDEQTGSM